MTTMTTMVTGQLAAADPDKQRYTGLADEGGIVATLWFGTASVLVHLDCAGGVSLVYDAGDGTARKPIFHSFMWELAAMRDFVSTEPDGTVCVELAGGE